MCDGVCRVEDAATLVVLHDCRFPMEHYCPGCGAICTSYDLNRLMVQDQALCVWCGTPLRSRPVNPI